MCKISSTTLRHPTIWNIYGKPDFCPAVYVAVGIKFQHSPLISTAAYPGIS